MSSMLLDKAATSQFGCVIICLIVGRLSCHTFFVFLAYWFIYSNDGAPSIVLEFQMTESSCLCCPM